MPDLELAQSIDPRAGYLQTAPEGLEYRVAVPLWGPWYQNGASWMYSDLPVESFYNPRTYPYPAENPYIPQRSGAYIQPGQADPLAYALVAEGNPLAAFVAPQKAQMGTLATGAVAAMLVYAATKRWKTALLWGAIMAGLKYFDPSPMGQIDWHVEDPTGGAYEGGGDPIYGDPLGPGANIAVASQWAGSLKPRGFAAQAKA